MFELSQESLLHMDDDQLLYPERLLVKIEGWQISLLFQAVEYVILIEAVKLIHSQNTVAHRSLQTDQLHELLAIQVFDEIFSNKLVIIVKKLHENRLHLGSLEQKTLVFFGVNLVLLLLEKSFHHTGFLDTFRSVF